MNPSRLKSFSAPYYEGKDIMHNLWHIELVYKSALRIIHAGNYKVDMDCLTAAAYFHGFVKSYEADIRDWLICEGFCEKSAEKTIIIAQESHAGAVLNSLEGKILHDAHLIEGGRVYMITKCLITGSLRGQTLPETIDYVENNIIDRRRCYLPETIPLFEQANEFTKAFLSELKSGL